jgi:hypothetical protein
MSDSYNRAFHARAFADVNLAFPAEEEMVNSSGELFQRHQEVSVSRRVVNDSSQGFKHFLLSYSTIQFLLQSK